MPIHTLAFDLYDTLLSVGSISPHLPLPHLSPAAKAIVCATWRTHQLTYTWRLNCMSRYIPFSEVTLLSLQNALADHGQRLTPEQQKFMIERYNKLDAFDDALEALAALSMLPEGVRPHMCVFSNGTSAMVGAGIKSGGLGLEHVSVHEVGVFKPDPKAYQHLVKRAGEEVGKREKEGRVDVVEAGEVWLVSGNPFDVVGAAGAGLGTVWVNREGAGWTDALGRPKRTVADLRELVGIVKKENEKRGN